MTRKPKLGRPKIPKWEQKKPFAIRFTDEQLENFERAAKAKGVTLREWITSCLIDATK